MAVKSDGDNSNGAFLSPMQEQVSSHKTSERDFGNRVVSLFRCLSLCSHASTSVWLLLALSHPAAAPPVVEVSIMRVTLRDDSMDRVALTPGGRRETK
ncbi:hypothetical protein EYF80_045363 [Liparis tanakae]|uniref:Uncharacterized protein n=1 Tax=Liparis tanakae TaxID=230148 RepID=A0A4Z2FTF8_9TELE|nr:hypothetical protein EYF80_045363 [Liparis tanakae]